MLLTLCYLSIHEGMMTEYHPRNAPRTAWWYPSMQRGNSLRSTVLTYPNDQHFSRMDAWETTTYLSLKYALQDIAQTSHDVYSKLAVSDMLQVIYEQFLLVTRDRQAIYLSCSKPVTRLKVFKAKTSVKQSSLASGCGTREYSILRRREAIWNNIGT